MKLKGRIFKLAKEKGLEPHSIVNNCVLYFVDGGCIIGISKREIYEKLKEWNQII